MYYKIGEGGRNWEGVFYFEAEVGEEAVKINQRDFQTASVQIKTNGNNVVEAKGGEYEEIGRHKEVLIQTGLLLFSGLILLIQ